MRARIGAGSALWLTAAAVGFCSVACGGGAATRPDERPESGAAVRRSGGALPRWAELGQHPEYPDAQFLTGLGSTVSGANADEDRQRADANARADLSKKISVQIEAVTKSTDWETNAGSGFGVEAQVAESVNVGLEGIAIPERHRDEAGGVTYSLAVLDRAGAARRLRAKVADGVARAADFEQRGESSLGRGEVTTGLRSLLSAHAEYSRVLVDATLLRALTGEAMTKVPIAGVQTRLDGILSAISLKVGGGDGQRGEVGKPLADPLTVAATWSDGGTQRPVPDLPVKFALDAGSAGRLDTSLRTGPDGRAAARVYEVGASEAAENRVTATIDWADFLSAIDPAAKAAWGTRAKAATAAFAYKLRTQATTRVAVRIVELAGDAPQRDQVLAAAVSQQLLQRKFDVVDARVLQKVGDKDLATATPDALRAAVGGDADVVVVGEVRAAYSSKVTEGFIMFRGKAQVRAVDTQSGQLLADLTFEVKAAGADDARAARACFDKMAKDQAAKVAEAVKAGLR